VEVLRSGTAEAHHTKLVSYELAAHRACVRFRTRHRSSVQPDIESSGVVAVVDPASRHTTASVAAVQQAVSTHPVSASGIRLSSRPVSGHLGWSSSGSSARPSAVHPSSPLLSSRAVSSRLVSSRRSGRVRLLPCSGGGVGTRWRWPGDHDPRTGGGPGGCRAVDGSIDGRGGRDAGDAADIALAGGRSVADRAAGWGAGCGGRVWPLSDQAGQAAMGSGRLRCGHGCRLQRADSCTGRMAGVLGWVCDHGGWSSPRLTPGWADPEGPGEGPAGMGARPQRGPGWQRALPACYRQRSELRRWLVGLPGLEPGTSSLSAIFR
jgi:hypothetical protein